MWLSREELSFSSSPFVALHQSDFKAYSEWCFKDAETELTGKNKELLEKWLSTLPKEIRDSRPGSASLEEWEEFSRLQNNFFLSHRSEYPAMSLQAADEEYERGQKEALRCIASDDPRLK